MTKKEHRSIDLDNTPYEPGPEPGSFLPPDAEIKRLAKLYEKAEHDIRYCVARVPITQVDLTFPAFEEGDEIVDFGPIMGCNPSVYTMQRFKKLEISSSYDGTHIEHAWVTLYFHKHTHSSEFEYHHSRHMTRADADRFFTALSAHVNEVLKITGTLELKHQS